MIQIKQIQISFLSQAHTMTKLFLSNLPLPKLPRSHHQIRTEISKFLQPHAVTNIHLVHNRDYNKGMTLHSRKFMNFCFVEVPSMEEASKVIQSKNRVTWLDAEIHVELAKEDQTKAQSDSQEKPKRKKKDIQVLEEDISTVPIADIGANLTSKRFSNDLADCMERAQQCNVTHMYITGTSWRESQRAVDIARRWSENPEVEGITMYTTAGIHPHTAKTYDKEQFAAFRTLIEDNRDVVVAVGETGLDYNRMFSTKEEQIESFKAHIELAIDLQLPLFLHERDAHEDFIAVLREYRGRLPPVCVHCFTGTVEELKVYVQEGFYIGFTGFINIHDRASHLYDHLGIIPRDRIMVETDAPYMLPFESSDPRRQAFNTRCEPFLLYHVVRKVAELRGELPEQLAKATFENTHRFFGTTNEKWKSARKQYSGKFGG